MKIAFVGKGGSGKTTVSSLFIRYLAYQGLPTVAIDADINQHLGVALGMPETQAATMPTLGNNLPELKEYLRGCNPRISSANAMVKTTPAGSGSQLLRVHGNDPFHQLFAHKTHDDVVLLATGPFSEEDLGLSCYHAKVGGAELYLNHIVDQPDEYIVVDMTAGADAFASGLFTRFDVTFLVVEPTLKSISVYNQYKQYAKGHDVTIWVIGNKVTDVEDEVFLRDAVGESLLTCLSYSPFVKAGEQGGQPNFQTLEPTNRNALQFMLTEVQITVQDWERFTRQGAEFHRRYAMKWGGADCQMLLDQIDPGFVMG